MFIAPSHAGLPPFSVMLDDLTIRAARPIALHLGISVRTLERYRRTGNAPRAAQLALYFETQWGLRAVNCQAVNGERVALGLARSLQRETAMLRARIARLEETGDFGAANSPLWTVL